MRTLSIFRILTLLCFPLFLLSCKTKPPKYQNLIGNWVSPTSLLSIRDTTGKVPNFLWSWYGYNGNHYFSLSRDTITFNPKENNDSIKFLGGIKCKILLSSDSFLDLLPLKDDAKQLLSCGSKLRFTRKEFLVDTTIKLERIIFHSTSCLGTCPVLHIEIDSDRRIYFKGKIYNKNSLRGMAISGTFKGQLEDSTYRKLIYLVQRCELRDLTYTGRDGSDASIRTLIMYFNHQRKQILSTFPPIVLDELITFFTNINEEVKMERTKENFRIEGDSMPPITFIPPRIK